MNRKTCNKCGSNKPFEGYAKDPRNKDGLQGICLDCKRDFKRADRVKRMLGIGVVPVSRKTCNKCQTEKPSNQFYVDSGISDGRSSTCKVCKNQTTQQWREANREAYNETLRAYNKKHYNRLRLNRYKLSLARYEAMLEEQQGKCACCNEPGKRLVVDHSHATGEVRALLCYACNRAIALLDNPRLYERILAFMETVKQAQAHTKE